MERNLLLNQVGLLVLLLHQVVVLGLQVSNPLLHLLQPSKLGENHLNKKKLWQLSHLNINLPLQSESKHAKAGEESKAAESKSSKNRGRRRHAATLTLTGAAWGSGGGGGGAQIGFQPPPTHLSHLPAYDALHAMQAQVSHWQPHASPTLSLNSTCM